MRRERRTRTSLCIFTLRFDGFNDVFFERKIRKGRRLRDASSPQQAFAGELATSLSAYLCEFDARSGNDGN